MPNGSLNIIEDVIPATDPLAARQIASQKYNTPINDCKIMGQVSEPKSYSGNGDPGYAAGYALGAVIGSAFKSKDSDGEETQESESSGFNAFLFVIAAILFVLAVIF